MLKPEYCSPSLGASIPKTEKVKAVPSGSVAVTVPIAVSFSLTSKVAEEVMDALSLRLLIEIVTAWSVVLIPSEAVTVMAYEAFVS